MALNGMSLFRSTYNQVLHCCQRLATTHFGFEEIAESMKSKRVHELFAGVASKYDFMNDAMSIGIHRLWKDYFVEEIGLKPYTKLLDVAGGTGDISFRALKKIQMGIGKGNVTVFDINEKMLQVGIDRATANHSIDKLRLKWVCGDAESLPFKNNTFDMYTIAFGIRNCTDINKVLTESIRVLKPGGKFACLEFSRVNSCIKHLYDFYSFQVIPVMGEIIAGNYKSYRYLVESIRRFPNQVEFSKMMTDVGYKHVRYENLSFGICAIHTGIKEGHYTSEIDEDLSESFVTAERADSNK